jgi:hypothetical protein
VVQNVKPLVGFLIPNSDIEKEILILNLTAMDHPICLYILLRIDNGFLGCGICNEKNFV